MFVDFKTLEVLVVGVLHALLLILVLLSHLLQGLSLVQLSNCPLKIFETKNQHRDVVERATRSCFTEHNFNSFGGRGVLIVVEVGILSAR